MTKTYFSTFITGFSDIVGEALKKRLPDAEIKLITDGLVFYGTHQSPEIIKQIRFFTNSFIALKYFPTLNKKSVDEMVRLTLGDKDIIPQIHTSIPKQRTTFRIMATQENQFVGIERNLKERLESKIAQNKNLVIDRALPDIEFLFTLRREGFGLFGQRLTRHTSYDKILEKGELYPELAHILCLLSEPTVQDRFLDPFCGWGSIPVARAAGFPYTTVYAADIDNKLIERTRLKAKEVKKQVIANKADALDLQAFADKSIDKIVTDPPWGLHDKELHLEKFYRDMLREFERIIKPNGLIIILTSQKDLFEKILGGVESQLKLIKKYDTLVSGQKAAAYKIHPQSAGS